MKKITILSAFLFISLILSQSYAQDTMNYASNLTLKTNKAEKPSVRRMSKRHAATNVSDYSLSSFNTDFGAKNNVSWTKTAHFDEATFNQNGQEKTAYYDFDGKLVGTTTLKSFNDLPERGQKTINKKYPEYTVESVLLYDINKQSNAQMLLFNSQYVDSRNYFVQLSNGKNRIILQVNPVGGVYFFKKL